MRFNPGIKFRALTFEAKSNAELYNLFQIDKLGNEWNSPVTLGAGADCMNHTGTL